VLLDRDGVLNRAYPAGDATRPPRSLAELEILPGVGDALALLAQAGFALVGVSNQPDVARGLATRAAVEAINAQLVARLDLLAILTCFHDDADACACRKPRPGLLFDAARRFDLDLKRSVMVGDRWSDVDAGRAAGCRAILIETPWSRAERCTPDARAADLAQAAALILRWQAGARGGRREPPAP
jgi:D-glycero-D-manno-heptose 1,7-bisphosphate phosphatase